jgi:Na+-transporting methylmalonyl-CoA/oxaloacetate decarboxylase gamma subunit
MKVSGSEALAVVFTGMFVVFFAILLLICIIWLMGKLIPKLTKYMDDLKSSRSNKNVKAESIPEAKPVTKAPVITTPTPEQVKATLIQNSEDEDEIVAVISTAVAMMSLADGKNYRVKSVKAIKSTTQGRPAWSMAGLRENTRPFRQR